MSERLPRLTPKTKQCVEPAFEGCNNEASPHATGHADGNDGDCKDSQPNYYMPGAVHGLHDSTAKALPHVVTALSARRAEVAGQIENLQGQVKRLTVDLDPVEETLRDRVRRSS